MSCTIPSKSTKVSGEMANVKRWELYNVNKMTKKNEKICFKLHNMLKY